MTNYYPQCQVAKDFLTQFIKPFKIILADPPWRFKARNGKLSPEHDKCYHYPTLPLNDIKSIPVQLVADKTATCTFGFQSP